MKRSASRQLYSCIRPTSVYFTSYSYSSSARLLNNNQQTLKSNPKDAAGPTKSISTEVDRDGWRFWSKENRPEDLSHPNVQQGAGFSEPSIFPDNFVVEREGKSNESKDNTGYATNVNVHKN